MEIEKIRKKTEKELLKMKEDLRNEFAEKYLEMRMGKIKNLKEPRQIRKDLAKVETVLKEKELDKLNKKKENGKAKT